MWPIPRFSVFLILYRVTEDEVEIVRVIHAREDITRHSRQSASQSGDLEALLSRVEEPAGTSSRAGRGLPGDYERMAPAGDRAFGARDCETLEVDDLARFERAVDSLDHRQRCLLAILS
jgi:hypothetical protein